MKTLSSNIYLGSFLAPLAPFLAQEDVTDLYVNRPGELWIERLGGSLEKTEQSALDRSCLERLARQVAAVNAQGINRENPLLAARLPDGSRIQIVMPPATRGDIAIAIRRHAVAEMSLDDFSFVDDRPPSVGTQVADDHLDRPYQNDPRLVLRSAVLKRKNILISGGTSSGKTTFLNALMREIPLRERLILIEDTAELHLVHPNAVGLIAVRGRLGEADVTAEDLLIASLRMRPDRILLGELRGKEAFSFLRAVNTGHPGSMTTIHADSPERALDQLALLVLQAGTQISLSDAMTHIRRSIDIIIQLKKGPKGRLVDKMHFMSDRQRS